MDNLLARIAELSQWQIALAATWLLLQACVIPSVPEEIVTTTMGMLVAQGRITAPLAVAAVLVGLLPANSAAVFIGSLARGGIGHAGFLGRTLSSPRVAVASEALRRHGPLFVVVTRFVPFVRGPVYLATGLSGFGVGRFFLLDAAAACVQVPLLLWLGSRPRGGGDGIGGLGPDRLGLGRARGGGPRGPGRPAGRGPVRAA